MLINYFKTAIRNFYRHLTYTSINVFGLTIGLATSILIYLWIADEMSYDRQHKDSDRIYAAISNLNYSDGTIDTGPETPGPLAEALRVNFPEVESAARADWGVERLLRFESTSILQRAVLVDPQIFELFSLKIIEGDASNPLPDINSVVLSESCAKRFFPNGDALGKVFRAEEKFDLKVTAIAADQRNSDLTFDFLASYEYALQESPWLNEWGNNNDKTYVKLKAGSSVEELNEKLHDFMQSKCKDCKSDIWLQALPETRLYDKYSNGKPVGGRIEYIRIFTVTGIFILAIACINFMNLATARSATRSREVGVRKVVGAQRKSLFFQFMGESMLISFLALLLALALVQILLPGFNFITEKQVYLDFKNVNFVLMLLAIALTAGLLAGSYPAVFLSAFKPVTVLKGNVQSPLTGSVLRKSLVVFQFVLSVVLIISSIVILKQVNYIKNKNLGFDRANVVTFKMRENLSKNKEAFKNQALSNAAISKITFAGQDPFSIGWMTTQISWPGKPSDAVTAFKIVNCDKDFISTLNMKIIQGRDFLDNTSDSTNFIVNETALKLMGIADPIGSPLEVWRMKSGKIVGVVEDFHNGHFSKAIEPQIIMVRPANTWTVFAKVEAQQTNAAIAHLAKLHKEYDPNYPFDYKFLDDKFNDLYRTETTTEKIAIYFTVVAVIISCLGLFGLASFTAERRTKELGVRKVLGASVGNLVTMLCADFTKLIMIALVIAGPVAYYLMDLFLAKYTYHMALHWGIFAVSFLLIFLFALLTVSYQSISAAMINPVNSLRSE